MSSWPKFKNVALPGELVDKIDKFIENSNYKYSSRPHLIKVALAEFFDKNNGGEIKNGNRKTT